MVEVSLQLRDTGAALMSMVRRAAIQHVGRRNRACVPIEFTSVPLIHDRIVLKIGGTDSSNLDTTRHDLSSHPLSSVLIQICLVVLDLARVDLAEQRHELGVQHGRKEFRVQCGVTKALREPVALVIGPFRVDFGHADFFIGGCKVAEGRDEGMVDVDLEDDDEEDGRESGDPDERPEAFLETDGY